MFPSCSRVSQFPESAPDPLLDALNQPQREAVLTSEGPVLMLAGAGTGKTAALTARLAHIIRTRRAWPSEILCVTFTNKAAREMRERVGQLVGPAVEGMPWLGTFHSIAAKILTALDYVGVIGVEGVPHALDRPQRDGPRPGDAVADRQLALQ
jgi:DNA helicase-2/ATP-dependent DNA helicase PcrA